MFDALAAGPKTSPELSRKLGTNLRGTTILLDALAALGLVTPAMLRGTRRAALVTCVAGACIITPGDLIVTSAALAIPMYLLYEVSIIIGKVARR